MRITLYNPVTDYASVGKISRMPLGLIAVAAASNLAGYDKITVVDDDLQHSADGFAERIIATNPDIVGMTTWLGGFPNIRELREKLPKEVPIVVGGALPSVIPKFHIEQGADIAVVGDGTEAFVSILKAIERKQSFQSIPGLFYRSGSLVIGTGKNSGAVTPPLTTGYQYFDMEEYVGRWPDGKRGAMVMGSRGCPFKCPFCSPEYRGTYCPCETSTIKEEVSYLTSQYGVSDLYLADGTFTYGDIKRLWDVCLSLYMAGVSWLCETRADCLDWAKATLMKHTGCRVAYTGLESASSAIDPVLRGGKSKEKTLQAVKILRDAGIEPVVFVLFGFPGETNDSIKETLDFIFDLNVKASPNVLFPIPTTPVWEMAQEKGLLPPLHEYLERLNEYNKRNRAYVAVPGMCEASEEAIIEAVHAVWKHNEMIGG